MKNLKIILSISLLLLCACATKSNVQTAQPDQELPINKNFDTIVFSDIELSPEFKADYPQAADDYLSSAMSNLSQKNKSEVGGPQLCIADIEYQECGVRWIDFKAR